MREPMHESMNERWELAKAEQEARLLATFAAYQIPFGTALENSQQLAHAQVTRRPMPVPVRMRTGELVTFSIEQAVKALLHGGRLEIENVEHVAENVASTVGRKLQRK